MPFDLTCGQAWIGFCVMVVVLRLGLGNRANPSDPDWLVVSALLLGALSVLILAILAWVLDRTFGLVVTVGLVAGYAGVLWRIFRRTSDDPRASALPKRKRKRYHGGRLPY